MSVNDSARGDGTPQIAEHVTDKDVREAVRGVTSKNLFGDDSNLSPADQEALRIGERLRQIVIKEPKLVADITSALYDMRESAQNFCPFTETEKFIRERALAQAFEVFVGKALLDPIKHANYLREQLTNLNQGDER